MARLLASRPPGRWTRLECAPRRLISQIKVIAPRVALEVIDQAVQMHGGAGVSQDFPLARMWTRVRTSVSPTGPTRCTGG